MAAVFTVLIIVLDGLRPDYVTAERMPNLYAMAHEGVYFERHHAVFPTVTRVNSPSIATGAYPRTHGLMGNSVYFPEVEPSKGMSTANANNLMAIEEQTDGKLLTAKSLAEVLTVGSMSVLACSSGSSGSAYLLNTKALGGGIVNVELVLPASNREHIAELLGPAPEEATPNAAQNRWAADAYLKFGLDEVKPRLTFLWLSDPDHTAHGKGMGDPVTEEALRKVDGEIGRIRAELKARGLVETTNIMVTSDHGFSTHTGGANLNALFKKAQLDEGVTVVDGAIYVNEHNGERIRAIVELLQETPWVGAIFTKAAVPGAMEGAAPGTLSFEAARWNHERAADILVSANWTDDANAAGFKGSTTQGGVAGHGTSSPWDVHNTLIAVGPSFKENVSSPVPSANVDIAPTICRILGLEAPRSMDGRVLYEALAEGPAPEVFPIEEAATAVETAGYRLELHESIVLDKRYFDFTRVTRSN